MSYTYFIYIYIDIVPKCFDFQFWSILKHVHRLHLQIINSYFIMDTHTRIWGDI